jgi:hypothetical protein
MRNAVHFLGGSLAVYVLMAACSAGSKGRTDNGQPATTTGGTANQATGAASATGGEVAASGGQATSGNGSIFGAMGGIVGAMMDPVAGAGAQEPPVSTVDEPCDKQFTIEGWTYFYAEHTYPGASVEALARVVALAHQTDLDWPAIGMPPGYSWRALPAILKEGAVAAVCLAGTTATVDTGPYDYVRFVGP